MNIANNLWSCSKRTVILFFQRGEKLGQCHLTQVTINTGDAKLVSQRPYCTPLAKRKIVDKCIDGLLQNGSIHPSVSPWASPNILVQKKHLDTNHQIAIDFLGLNSFTIKNWYPLPNIHDICWVEKQCTP